MRVVVMLAGLTAGCFAPTTPSGVPCDPATGYCPANQVCTAQHVCAPPGSDARVVDVLIDDAPFTDATDGPVDAGPSHFEYIASIAECLNPANPSTAACKTANGSAQLVVDLRDTVTAAPWQSFVHFDLDAAFAGKTLTSVKLRMVATSAANAPGPNSGDLWAVTSFTAGSLSSTPPSKMMKYAGTQGAVVKLQPVEWPMPTSSVAPNGAVYLGIYGTVADGVNYWNLAGPNPPKLIIDTL